jgi:hypothetical protein
MMASPWHPCTRCSVPASFAQGHACGRGRVSVHLTVRRSACRVLSPVQSSLSSFEQRDGVSVCPTVQLYIALLILGVDTNAWKPRGQPDTSRE